MNARYPPSSAIVRIRKITGRECWAIQCWPPVFGEFTPTLRSSYFSPDASLPALDPSADGFASSDGAGVAIVIFVLSGRP